MTKKYKVKTTPLQKKGVDNIMSGNYKSKKDAIKAAGMSDTTAHNPQLFVKQKGVQAYLKTFEQKAVVKFGMSLDEKIMDVYLDGLDADKPLGKHGEVIQDHKMRKEFADTIQESRGMMKSKQGGAQINYFFMFDKESRSQFNDAFSEYVRGKSLED